MSSLFQSIRWRLQAWHGLILLGAVVALCVTVSQLVQTNQIRQIDRLLFEAEHTFIRALVRATQPEGPNDGPIAPELLAERLRTGRVTLPPELSALFGGSGPGSAYFILQDHDGRVLLRSENAPTDRRLLAPTSDDFVQELRTVGHFRESLRTARVGVAFLVGRDISAEQQEMRRLTGSVAAAGAGVWLLGLFGGWWLAGRAIRPIDGISRAATRIADGDLRERINVRAGDSELDQLGRVLNRTFDRLHESVESQRRFTADAAHELRTPVSILLTETQRVLKREREPEEYRESLRMCQDAAGRMRRLVESLLLLARLENEQAAAAPRREPCDLAAIASDTASRLAPLAEERRVRLRLDLHAARCAGDPDALGILLGNLVGNAIQHHRDEGGEVWIRTNDEGGRAVAVVRDDGPGIPEGELPRIFERFHRADAARTGGSGHTGLGLAIARTIVENHGGLITANSRPGTGACFTVSLPAA